jgi:peroxiredoxin
MKKISGIALLASLFLILSCQKNAGDVTIEGNFRSQASTRLYVWKLLPDSKPLLDSLKTDAAGNFSITLAVKDEGFYTLGTGKDGDILFILKPGEKVTLKADAGKSYSVSGSPETALYADYFRSAGINLARVDSLSGVFAASRTLPDFAAIKTRLDSAYMAIFADQQEKAIRHVKQNLNALSSLLVITGNFGPNPLLTESSNRELYFSLDSALFKAYPKNSLVGDFHQRVTKIKESVAASAEREKKLNKGMPAPEISLPDLKGNLTTLSSYKGRLTLLYFWSSWDAAARKMNMDLGPVFNQYFTRGFAIFAVSLDTDAEAWKNAARLDKAYWTQVNDPKGPSSEYCKTYGVEFVPKLILIGKDGTILARDPGLEDLKILIAKNI